MLVVVAATGGVQPALGPRPLKSSRALHRAGTLTLASPSAPSALLQPSAARPSDLRPLQTQVKKIPKITTRSAATQAEAKRSGVVPNLPRRRGVQHSPAESRGRAAARDLRSGPLGSVAERGGERAPLCVGAVLVLPLASLRLCLRLKWFVYLPCFAYPAASHSGTALAR